MTVIGRPSSSVAIPAVLATLIAAGFDGWTLDENARHAESWQDAFNAGFDLRGGVLMLRIVGIVLYCIVVYSRAVTIRRWNTDEAAD